MGGEVCHQVQVSTFRLSLSTAIESRLIGPLFRCVVCVYCMIGYESASYAGHANMGRPDSRSVASAGELGMDQKAFEAETNSTGAIPPRANEAPDLLW
jgi:hypothetical protein